MINQWFRHLVYTFDDVDTQEVSLQIELRSLNFTEASKFEAQIRVQLLESNRHNLIGDLRQTVKMANLLNSLYGLSS